MNPTEILARWLAEQVEIISVKFFGYKNSLRVPDVPTRRIDLSGYKAGPYLRRSYGELEAPEVVQTVDTRGTAATRQGARPPIVASAPKVPKA